MVLDFLCATLNNFLVLGTAFVVISLFTFIYSRLSREEGEIGPVIPWLMKVTRRVKISVSILVYLIIYFLSQLVFIAFQLKNEGPFEMLLVSLTVFLGVLVGAKIEYRLRRKRSRKIRSR